MSATNTAPQNSKNPVPQRLSGTTDRRREVEYIFETQYLKYVGIATRMLHDFEEARDIVSSVFHKLLEDKHAGKLKEVQCLESYLTTCTRNACHNWIKREILKREIIQAMMIHTTSKYNPMTQFDLDMNVFLKMLPDRERGVITLYLEGYSHEEIAEQLGCTEKASRNGCSRAKNRLRQLLGMRPDQDPEDDGNDNPGSNRKKMAKSDKQWYNAKAHKPRATGAPGIVDLLQYMSSIDVSEKGKVEIKAWIVSDDNAFEVISGLRIALRNNSTIEIHRKTEQSKNKLREELFGKKTINLETNVLRKPPLINVMCDFWVGYHKKGNANIPIDRYVIFIMNTDNSINHRFENLAHCSIHKSDKRLINLETTAKSIHMKPRNRFIYQLQNHAQENCHEYITPYEVSDIGIEDVIICRVATFESGSYSICLVKNEQKGTDR